MTAHVFIGVAVLLSVLASPALAAQSFVGSVKKVIDGDSLLIVSEGKTIEVRLYGIDCPEYQQPFSNVAKTLVKKEVYGQKVLVTPEYYDTYNRMVAIVSSGDDTLNSKLVLSGLAWVYPHFCHKDICNSWEQMEKSAREAKRGLWSARQPVPPWLWKRRKHSN